ncbi:MarR family winged helix-turn-helix transcriptional regulator [Novosphingobium sp. RL4]|uniref:MarR family winged helix-turn-helix transcriptional regulator n=1 Tax=Novosphingobium sp. RL4 TaxID=3109595 RepID=UPI002D792BC0|nr:MarR family winged helix-turn-helix transcriptional regulator [Novosphingobium sp. RL4]WRT94420.1 MarR family winged helix-turn-helix transcriptional regulator [Novosphingobium sp. RL4]
MSEADAQAISVPHTPEGSAVTDLIMTIFRANGRLLRGGDTLSKELGLTAARWQVLGAIAQTPKTVAQIARDYELTRQGILWVVQSLVKDGMVELVKNPDHRRAKLVRNTDKGRETFEEVSRRQHIWSNDLGQAFNTAELQAAVDVVRRLSEMARGTEEDDE